MTQFLFFILFFWTTFIHSITVIIDVPGSVYTPGRQIKDHFERGILLSLADQIKKTVSLKHPDINTIFYTHTDQLSTTPTSRAHRYNTIAADLLLTLAAYQEETDPHVYIYQFVHDTGPYCQASLYTLYPFCQAYLKEHNLSKEYACLGSDLFCQKPYNQQFITSGPFLLPLSPLAGITTPAFLIEMGIVSNTQIDLFTDPIVALIHSIAERKTKPIWNHE